MNKTIYGLLGGVLVTVLAGCSKDLPFEGPGVETGGVSRTALGITVSTAEFKCSM